MTLISVYTSIVVYKTVFRKNFAKKRDKTNSLHIYIFYVDSKGTSDIM